MKIQSDHDSNISFFGTLQYSGDFLVQIDQLRSVQSEHVYIHCDEVE